MKNLAGILVALACGPVLAEGGTAAPPFELTGSDGAVHRLSDQAGKRVVVLAWFPKAFTGG